MLSRSPVCVNATRAGSNASRSYDGFGGCVTWPGLPSQFGVHRDACARLGKMTENSIAAARVNARALAGDQLARASRRAGRANARTVALSLARFDAGRWFTSSLSAAPRCQHIAHNQPDSPPYRAIDMETLPCPRPGRS